MAIGKSQRLVARGGEAEQAIGPVMNRQNGFFKKSTHDLVGPRTQKGSSGSNEFNQLWGCHGASATPRPGEHSATDGKYLAIFQQREPIISSTHITHGFKRTLS
jgi:hypothetical protein